MRWFIPLIMVSCTSPQPVAQKEKLDPVQLNILCMQYCLDKKMDFGIITKYEPDPDCTCFTKKPEPI